VGAAVLLLSVLVGVPTSSPVEAQESTIAVHDEAEWRAALVTLSADSSGPHTIEIAADFTMAAGPTPTYTGVRDLDVEGGGHTVSATGTGFGLLFGDVGLRRTLVIEDLTVTGFASAGPGGAVRWLGDVRILNSELSHNTATSGVGGAMAAGTIQTVGSRFEGNQARRGGALFAAAGASVDGSELEGNTATNGGGGAVLTGIEFSAVYTFRSSFIGNSAANGGAIVSDFIRANRSTFEDNEADGSGGAVRGEVSPVFSSFVGNRASIGGAIAGPGVIGLDTTFVDNRATIRGGAVSAIGGRINLNYITLLRNQAPEGAHLAVGRRPLTFKHSAIGAPGGGGTSCSRVAPGNRSSYTFDDDETCLGIGPGNRSGRGPLVGPLERAANGTLFAEPVAGSPLVDSIPTSACGNEEDDQRDVTRPQGSACDMGAIERD
jgi:Chlamydia polymorphic membrane protein (Chlamydia_PMP) repeat